MGRRFIPKPVLMCLKAQKLLGSELTPVSGCPSHEWTHHCSVF